MVEVFQNREQPISTFDRHFVIRDLDEAEALFPNRTVTYFDDELGARRLEEVTLYRAGCSHIIGYEPAELRAYCDSCGCSLCAGCATILCASCLRRQCPSCAKVFRQTIYCPRDYALERTKRIACGLAALFSWLMNLRVG